METLLELPWWFLVPLAVPIVLFWSSVLAIAVLGGAALIEKYTNTALGTIWAVGCCLAVVTYCLLGCGDMSELEVESNAKYQIHGVVIYADTEAYPSRYVMQEATDLYIERVAWRFGWSEAALVRVFKDVGSIVFLDHGLTTSDGQVVNGLYKLRRSDILLDYVPPCVRQSSYWHELNHHFLHGLLHDIDAPHKEEVWWRDLLLDVRKHWVNGPVREEC